MKREWDPWHTVTVSAVTIAGTGNDEYADDVETKYEVVHPEPHENGCPERCMTQQEIDQGGADGLPTEPGVYRIRAWGEYWPATMCGDPAEFDGGIEVEQNGVVAR